MRKFTAVLILGCILVVVAHSQVSISDEPTRIFLDPQQPQQVRVAAAHEMDYPTEEVFVELLQILLDRTEPDTIRAAAAVRHRYNDSYVDVALNILGDPEDGGATLNARLIEDIRRRTVVRHAAAREQRIRNVLRNLLDDTRNSVRLEAYRTLVGSGDTIAIKKLTDSLASGAIAVVSVEDALQLLDVAGGIHHLALVRRFLEDDRASVKALAVEILASDPKSRPRIVELVTDRTTNSAVRLAGLSALSREDPRFEEYAISIVEADPEESRIRSAAMKAIVGRLNYGNIPEGDQIRFANALERIASERNRGLREAVAREEMREAEKILRYIAKNFPAIKRHYETR